MPPPNAVAARCAVLAFSIALASSSWAAESTPPMSQIPGHAAPVFNAFADLPPDPVDVSTIDAEGAVIPVIILTAYRLGLIAYPILQSCTRSPTGGVCGAAVSLAKKAVAKYCSKHKC